MATEEVDVEFVRQLQELHDLYGELPRVKDCKGICWNACGPIDMSDAERRRITELGVDIPVFTTERSRQWSNNEPLYCPALKFSPDDYPGGVGCSVYDDRPLICRVWGVGEGDLACPHGCETTGTLTYEDVCNLMMRSFEIGGHDGDMAHAGQLLKEALADPKMKPLMERFMQGDESVVPAIQNWMRRR